MKKRYFVVLLLLAAAVACEAQYRTRRITTLEDAIDHSKTLGPAQGVTPIPEAGPASSERKPAPERMTPREGTASPEVAPPPERADPRVGVRNVIFALAEQPVTNRGVVAGSTVLLVTFEAAFRTSQARCRQPVFQARGQVQHADTTRSRLSAGASAPYNAALPAGVIDAATIPATSKVTLKIPAKAGDRVLHLAILTVDGRAVLWETGRELRDDESAGKPER